MTPSPSPLFRFRALALTLAAAACVHPAQAAASCQYTKLMVLPIRYAGAALQPTVDGAINGKPANIVFNTGAMTSMLSSAAAARRGIPVQATGSYNYDVGGASVLYNAKLSDFSVGSIHSGKTDMSVLSGDDQDGTVGADFMFQADMELDLANKLAKFYRPKDCDDTYLAYWDQNAVELPFDQRSADDVRPRFVVLLNGVKLSAIISSASTTTSVFVKAAKAAGVVPGAPGVKPASNAASTGANTVKTWTASFDSIAFGEEIIQNPKLLIVDTPVLGTTEDMPDIILGADFLRAHHVLFASKQRHIYISYNGAELFADEPGPARAWIRKEAEAGNADAQRELVKAYRERGDAQHAELWQQKLDAAAAKN